MHCNQPATSAISLPYQHNSTREAREELAVNRLAHRLAHSVSRLAHTVNRGWLTQSREVGSHSQQRLAHTVNRGWLTQSAEVGSHSWLTHSTEVGSHRLAHAHLQLSSCQLRRHRPILVVPRGNIERREWSLCWLQLWLKAHSAQNRPCAITSRGKKTLDLATNLQHPERALHAQTHVH